MWMWNLFVVLCVSNVIVCQYRSSNYEDPWEQLGYGFPMNPSGFQPTVYRNRVPRQVYYYDPSEEDQSMISIKRSARSNYFNDPSLIAQEIIGRKSSFIDYQLQNSDEESELPPLNEAVLRSIKNRSQKEES
ncbi:unnamed protein product [Meganyctiphanes norvegica]|uniref:Uncharacterized protein n=1 Tax=Meganyctiphanes norvegica TaxID=48144 RepID=A0AAV2RUZ5_MEGNR